MLCESCKKEVPDDSAFCPFCGARISSGQQAAAVQYDNPPPRPPPASAGSYATSPAAASENRIPDAANYQLAKLGDRFVAGLLDGLILLIPSIILNQIIPVLGGLLVGITYYLYFMSQSGGGRTVGYKVMKLRPVNELTSAPAEHGPVAIWYLVLALACLISWIWYFTDQNRRMLHNIASHTIVIKEE